MRTSILRNLIELYRIAALHLGIPYGSSFGLDWVRNEPACWPSSSVGMPDERNLPELVRLMDSGELPPFLIVPGLPGEATILFFRRQGIREILRWEGMYLEPEIYERPASLPEQYEVRPPLGPSMLNDWRDIVQKVMLTNKEFPTRLLEQCASDPRIDLLCGFCNGRPVSTGMAYRNETVAGLYFIATLPEFQGKGYAKALVARFIEDCFSSGIREIVLHASGEGEKLYRRLGFVPDGTLHTFWKLGKY